ncbi:hypothetical protein DL98DRAFT_415128 [Cadophora sp. DSE1049]|nr:hypothetical protein DL98DRAFT_415128 [Cadophora sp. DSE1049]
MYQHRHRLDTIDHKRDVETILSNADGSQTPKSDDDRTESTSVLPTNQDAFTDSGYGSKHVPSIKPALGTQSPYPKILEETSEYADGTVVGDSAVEHHSETKTQFSDTSSLQDPNSKSHILELAGELYAAFPPNFDSRALRQISDTLPSLLKEFAVRLACNGASSSHGKLKYFIYRYYRDIINVFHERYPDEDIDQEERKPASSDEMTLRDKMSLWQNNENKEPIMMDPEAESKYRRVLTESAAFAWLSMRLKVNTSCETPGGHSQNNKIRARILESLGRPNKISRKDHGPVHTVTFELNWDPVSFFHHQQYSMDLSDVLANAVVLTGSEDNNVQASTCIQYLSQTWPDTGVHILQLLQRTFGSEEGIPQTSVLPDGSELNARYKPTSVNIVATGNSYSISEIGEQLAWLGAALRSSPNEQGVTYCKPIVTEFSLNICKIAFEFQAQSPNSSIHGGGCWRNLFHNPVVVLGYPIPRRSRPNSGLEVSLDLLSILTNARRMVNFRGRTFLKGFSTMLAATEIVEDVVLWHMFFNADGTHISYGDVRVPRGKGGEESLRVPNPDAKRHILGWCANVKNYAGKDLPSPYSSCAFEKVSVSAGKFVNVGMSCAIGIKDKPVHLSFGDDYVGMLLTISSRHFVFHDLDDRRAWLIDGASALLHLLRASIKHYQNDRRLRHIFKFDYDDFEEAITTHTGADAAFDVLLNAENQNLPLYPKTTETWAERTMTQGKKTEEVYKEKTFNFCLKDRVDQICNILEQIMAHQDDVNSQSGVGFRLRSTPRRQLEGFDFMDVATSQGTLWPKVANLNATGAGWVDFTRKIHAISLFGTGFGDLLRPASQDRGCVSCLYNDEVPKGRDYLAVSIVELKEILKTKGNMRSNPWRLVDDVYWHTPDKSFERCGCTKTPSSKHDRIQVLLPSAFPKFWGLGLRSPGKLASNGAVLFGHSWKFPLRWGASGNPEEGNPVLSPEDTDSSFYDSGISSAQHSSTLDKPEALKSSSKNASSSENAHQGSDTSLYSLTNRQFVHHDQRGKHPE